MNGSPRREWDAARSESIDAAEARKREQAVQRRKELEAEGRIDSGCRFARFDIFHECENSDGAPLRPWSTCSYEAFAQVREQQAAEAQRIADAMDIAAEPDLTPRGPKYRRVQ